MADFEKAISNASKGMDMKDALELAGKMDTTLDSFDLINGIIPGFSLNTNEISKALGRGKHTTREVTLYSYKEILLGDTPGFSKFDLQFFDINEDELAHLFPEFDEYVCKFNDCAHLKNTPGCGVYEAYVNGKILDTRYLSYLK